MMGYCAFNECVPGSMTVVEDFRCMLPVRASLLGCFVERSGFAREYDMTDDSKQDADRGTEHQGANQLNQVQGTVKWFDPRKGFGFIIGPDEQDIFVHFTVIEGDGFRVLKDGSAVCYDAEKNEKGWRATKVYAIVEEESEDGAPEVVVPRRTYSRTPRR